MYVIAYILHVVKPAKNYPQDVKTRFVKFITFSVIAQNGKANYINFRHFLTYKTIKYCILQLQDGYHYYL